MARLVLVCWDAEQAERRAASLRRAGHEVTILGSEGGATLPRQIGDDRPDAVIVDLDRRPSHGREVAMALRERKATRTLPVVLAGGEPEKVEAVRQRLPDASYCSWRGIAGGLRKAMAATPSAPAVPSPRPSGYSGTPLPKKLGIKEGTTVALLDAPAGFERTLGELPPDVVLRRDARGPRALTLWFVTSPQVLSRRIGTLAAAVGPGQGLWVAWPKGSSPLATTLREDDVRREGLAVGLVDIKVCAIDADWSGLRLARRRGG